MHTHQNREKERGLVGAMLLSGIRCARQSGRLTVRVQRVGIDLVQPDQAVGNILVLNRLRGASGQWIDGGRQYGAGSDSTLASFQGRSR